MDFPKDESQGLRSITETPDLDKVAEALGTSAKPLSLVLLAGLPGVGKSTLAEKLAALTGGRHFDIDDVKREVVPPDQVGEEIDPPEMRQRYYLRVVQMLPELFANNASGIVILDETFPVRSLRRWMNEVAEHIGIRIVWVEVVCDDELVQQRLSEAGERHNHLLGAKAWPMHQKFKSYYEPFTDQEIFESVDTSKDTSQVAQQLADMLLGS